MTRAERLQRMLDRIDERLEAYSVEETAQRLKSYKGEGPTVNEFYQDMHPVSSMECEDVEVVVAKSAAQLAELQNTLEIKMLELKEEMRRSVSIPLLDSQSHRSSFWPFVGYSNKRDIEGLLPIAGSVDPDTVLSSYQMLFHGASGMATPHHMPERVSALDFSHRGGELDGWNGAIYINVGIMDELSYPETRSFIIGQHYFEAGHADAVSFTDTQEGSESHEAA